MSTFLVYNAKIWNSDGDDFDWFVFDKTSGRVTAVGYSAAPVSEYSETNRRDYKGKRILPGLQEAHIHVSILGQSLEYLDLKECSSIHEFQQRIKSYHNENQDSDWILGRAWEQDKMGRYPTREDIDQIVSDKPVFLLRICEHIAVANSAALKLAGVTSTTPDPEGGTIDRFPKDHPLAGEPNGMLRETPAYEKVYNLVKVTKGDKIRRIKKGLQKCLECGVTAVHTNEPPNWEEYTELSRKNELPIRVFYAAYYDGRYSGNFPKPGAQVGDMLSSDRIKIFADGALGACTASMSLPYKNSKCNHGVLIQSQETLNNHIKDATAAGFRLEVHVIGDKAADSVLTALEKANVRPEKRPILTHCQILREDLLGRMKDLGAVANIQPQFVPTDARWIGELLQPQLLDYSYAWKTLLLNGIACAGGSDAPVETPEPLQGIYDAIFRPAGRGDSFTGETFRPDECLTVKQAIDLYTKGAAYATMREHDLGQIQPGFFADFVVLDNKVDVVADPQEFAHAKVGEVWVAGIQRL